MKKTRLQRSILNKIISFGICLSLLITIFLWTNPNNVSLAVLLIPFLLIGYLIYTLIGILFGLSPRLFPNGALHRLIPFSLAFLVVALLLLASLGQLTLRDSLLVTLFTLFFLLYVARADFLK